MSAGAFLSGFAGGYSNGSVLKALKKAGNEGQGDAPKESPRPMARGIDVVPGNAGGFDHGRIDPEIAKGIRETADALGISPVDLATTISYETGGTFDPTKAGPTTKWGRHRGLIQFGEPQAKQYGVDWDDPIRSQLGKDGAIARYLRDRGVKPGMGLLDIYSTINAGAPGLYDRSDSAAGGAPGTVADKVRDQMGGHLTKAKMLLDYYTGETPKPATTVKPRTVMAALATGDGIVDRFFRKKGGQ